MQLGSLKHSTEWFSFHHMANSVMVQLTVICQLSASSKVTAFHQLLWNQKAISSQHTYILKKDLSSYKILRLIHQYCCSHPICSPGENNVTVER